jgi:hypothetical protein
MSMRRRSSGVMKPSRSISINGPGHCFDQRRVIEVATRIDSRPYDHEPAGPELAATMSEERAPVLGCRGA